MKAYRRHLIYLVAISILASGTSLSLAQEKSNKIKTKVQAKTANEVTLFYGGSGDIKEVFPIGSVLLVYQRNLAFGPNVPQQIGKLEVVSYVDDNHFKGKMLSGKARVGDVLKLKPGRDGPAAVVSPPFAPFTW